MLVWFTYIQKPIFPFTQNDYKKLSVQSHGSCLQSTIYHPIGSVFSINHGFLSSSWSLSLVVDSILSSSRAHISTTMSWWKCSAAAAQLLSSRWLSSTFGGESKERPSAKYFSRRPSLLQRLRSFPTSIKSQSDHLGNFVCSVSSRATLVAQSLGESPPRVP